MPRPLKDITGQRFGKVTVLAMNEYDGTWTTWRCRPETHLAEGLFDGPAMGLDVPHHHFEDCLTLLGTHGFEHAFGHTGETSCDGTTVDCHVTYAVDNAVGVATYANLFDFCHNFKDFKGLD